MASLNTIIKRQREVSTIFSRQTRIYGGALFFLGLVFLLLKQGDRTLSCGLAIIGLLVLAVDLIQYAAATNVAAEVLDRAELSEDKEALYNSGRWTYILMQTCFPLKGFTLGVGCVLLICKLVEFAQ